MSGNKNNPKSRADSVTIENKKKEEKKKEEIELEREFYKQGSEACRNYSQLTMRIRTLSQQVLVASSIGLAAILSNEKTQNKATLFYASAISLMLFSISLAVVDWHYQSAFTSIRNSLFCIEEKQKKLGPWIAHLCVRTSWADYISSYSPFLFLFIIGCLAFGYGLSLRFEENWHIYLLIPALIGGAGTLVLLFLCIRDANRVKSHLDTFRKDKDLKEIRDLIGIYEIIDNQIDQVNQTKDQ